MKLSWIWVTLIAVGCSSNLGPEVCYGEAALRISVQLDQNAACSAVLPNLVGTLTLDGATLSLTATPGPGVTIGAYDLEYVIPWPSTTRDSDNGSIVFSGSGASDSTGMGQVDFAAYPESCQTVVVPVHCTFPDSSDAGLPDAL